MALAIVAGRALPEIVKGVSAPQGVQRQRATGIGEGQVVTLLDDKAAPPGCADDIPGKGRGPGDVLEEMVFPTFDGSGGVIPVLPEMHAQRPQGEVPGLGPGSQDAGQKALARHQQPGPEEEEPGGDGHHSRQGGVRPPRAGVTDARAPDGQGHGQ